MLVIFISLNNLLMVTEVFPPVDRSDFLNQSHIVFYLGIFCCLIALQNLNMTLLGHYKWVMLGVMSLHSRV